MGKLMVVVTRFLSLCAVLLALPAVAAAQPNLQPTPITFDASTAVVGGTVFFDSGVSNTGDVDTGVFNIKWFVDGQEVGAYGSHSGVPANSTVLDSNSQFSWVATAGTHTITFAVDVDNHVVESDESDNSTSVTVTAGPHLSLKVTKKAVSGKAVQGGNLLYTIVIKNNSDTDATNVTLVDKLPRELWPIYIEHIDPNEPNIKPIMPTQGNCTHTEYPIAIECNLGKIMAGEEARISYAVGVMGRAEPGKISNLVTVKSDQSKPATVKETVNIVKPSGISDKELNKIIDSVQGCAGLFIDYPFWDSVNLLIGKLNRQEITPAQFQAGFITATLDLIKLLTENHELGLLNDLFSVKDCVNFGRLLFSIPD